MRSSRARFPSGVVLSKSSSLMRVPLFGWRQVEHLVADRFVNLNFGELLDRGQRWARQAYTERKHETLDLFVITIVGSFGKLSKQRLVLHVPAHQQPALHVKVELLSLNTEHRS